MINKWEPVAYHNDFIITTRLKVFGGWLVKNMDDAGDCMVFVPDAQHEWKL